MRKYEWRWLWCVPGGFVMVTIVQSEVCGSTTSYYGEEIYVYNNTEIPETIDDHCEEE